MNKSIAGLSVSLLFLAGCSTGGDTVAEVATPIDFTGRVCESPIYREIIGTYSGSMQFSAGGRFCVWETTVTVMPATSDDQSCEIEGTIASTVVQQGPQTNVPFACDSGVREVMFVNGLKIGDDLTTIRPVSLGFNFLPFLEQTDAAGNELVPVVTQSEFGVVEMDGLSLNNGTLQKAVAGKLERQY